MQSHTTLLSITYRFHPIPNIPPVSNQSRSFLTYPVYLFCINQQICEEVILTVHSALLFPCLSSPRTYDSIELV